MDSRESPHFQHHHHHHHHQHHQPPTPPSGMMMAPPPNSYPTTTTTTTTTPNTSAIMQNPRFPFNSSASNSQYGDGSPPPSSGLGSGGFSIEPARKKRGRPRKYSPDGNIALGLAPSPITPISVPAHGDSNAGAIVPVSEPSSKRSRGRPPGSGKKQLDALGSPGVGFTPHVIIVKAGEDIATKIMAFSQQGPRSICILSANGAVSNVTLRQPAMSSGTVTYEGRFEIISLSGSFSLSESNDGGNRNRASALSVSLAGSDGRVLGGGVAGMLVAATPVQVIVGSFIADGKKSKSGPSSAPAPAPAPAPAVAPAVAPAPTPVPTPNMVNFGGPVPGISPPSEGVSSESSDESGSSPFNRGPSGPYGNNASQPIQNVPMYTNMNWPNSTVNMLPN